MLLAIDTSSYHPSTRLALAAILWLECRISESLTNENSANENSPENGFHKLKAPENILDIGCGNGILAVAAADIWNVPVLACDISKAALDNAGGFISQYAADRQIRLLHSDGFNHPEIRRRAPYDLIMANLIAKWQVKMANDIEKCLNQGGAALLSGILLWQEEGVEQALSLLNIDIIQKFAEGQWRCFLAVKKDSKQL